METSSLKINRMGYSRVYSLGNYENEKISVEADLPEGYDPTQAYVELQDAVNNAHNLRAELRKYREATNCINNKEEHTPRNVKIAEDFLKEFQKKYPHLNEVKALAMVNPEQNDY